MVGAPHSSKPDVDNLAKAFMDASKTEDSHVYSLQAGKYWAEAGSIELEAQR
ncbi:RusA family crossover junction endodeoxyribonuclease [Cumulibacter manganitolerans]|uniref:RusA family crossover junction endodeoxyribonuclease n=1 Tax=Cumulibacter manganitolerans TaxID=1884992 RepID=UPI0012957773|nr:RusA family crossover junction endodeoxyribonuclease [Cumulibacter manganitolerans]